MTIANLKELSKLVDLCRKKGIDSIKIDNIEFKLGVEPKKKSSDPELAPQVEYSQEDILNWSTGALSEAV